MKIYRMILTCFVVTADDVRPHAWEPEYIIEEGFPVDVECDEMVAVGEVDLRQIDLPLKEEVKS